MVTKPSMVMCYGTPISQTILVTILRNIYVKPIVVVFCVTKRQAYIILASSTKLRLPNYLLVKAFWRRFRPANATTTISPRVVPLVLNECIEAGFAIGIGSKIRFSILGHFS